MNKTKFFGFAVAGIWIFAGVSTLAFSVVSGLEAQASFGKTTARTSLDGCKCTVGTDSNGKGCRDCSAPSLSEECKKKDTCHPQSGASAYKKEEHSGEKKMVDNKKKRKK